MPNQFDAFDRAAAAASGGRPATTESPMTPDGEADGVPSSRVEHHNGFVASLAGVADTVTFGWDDEFFATLDSAPTWLGGNGGTYEQSLKRIREELNQTSVDHPYLYGTGQFAGAFVPVLGWAGKAKTAAVGAEAGIDLLGMVRAGAAQGALYGAGSADGDTWADRLLGASGGAVAGGLGGFLLGAVVAPVGRKAISLFKWGKPVKFNPEFKFNTAKADGELGARATEDLTALRREVAGTPTPKSPNEPLTTPNGIGKVVDEGAPLWNDLTGGAANVLEKDAVVSGQELYGMGRQAAKRLILDRIAKLTPQAAERMAKSLQKAEESGDLLSDPHYRSLLGIDLAGSGMDEQTMLNAAVTMEDTVKALVDRAGLGKRTTKSIDQEMRSLYGHSVVESDLDAAAARSTSQVTDTRLAGQFMAMAAMGFQRAKTKYLPDIMNGSKEAREKLAEELSSAIRISAKAQVIISNTGRALGDLSKARKLAFTEVSDGVAHIEDAASIKARVDSALKELNDTDLTELMKRMKSFANVDELTEVLLNPEHAKNLSNWQRAKNSLGLYLKSNSLTPASGLFNTVGFILHDAFRNGAAKTWAAGALERAGQHDEAAILRFEVSAANRVYWEAHRRGLKAMLNRVKWEWWDSVEKIAGVSTADSKLALKATSSKMALMQNGYEPPALREFDKMGRAAVTDVSGFNQKIASMQAEGGAFATLVGNLQRAGATALNTVDALGTGTARLISGALDDWGGAFVRVKETYALAARHAMREALETGLPQDEMAEYASKRAQYLAEMPTADILDQVEGKLATRQDLNDTDHFLLNLRDQTEKESSAVLFTDGPQTRGGRLAAQAATGIDKVAGLGMVEGLLMRYIRTPTRILERGLASYTPWAAKTDEVAKILAKGGIEAEIEKARMEIGAFVMGIGAMGAAAGGFTFTNGGWQNSANLAGGPPDRLNLPGGGHIEIGRLDPFSTTLSLGGAIGQAIRNYQHDKAEGAQAEEALISAFNIAYFAIRDSVLEKSYLTGLRDAMKGMFSDQGAEGMGGAYAKMLEGAFTNVTPFAGTVRQLNDTFHGDAVEAHSWVDKFLRAVPGMERGMPSRIDALGDPVDGRVLGVDVALSGKKDPIRAQLADLGVNISDLPATERGFKLTSAELSELRKIRGHEATNGDGLTMRDALGQLFADPEFVSMAKDDKHDAITKLMAGFNEPARALFEERNPNYAADRAANKSLTDYMHDGLSRPAARQSAIADTLASGLPEPTRLQ